jgi:polyferredoxin
VSVTASRLGKVQYNIRRYRRVSQLAILSLLVLAPFLHIFRFDIQSVSLYLFGMRLWVKHFFLFSLLMTGVIYVIIAASLLFGRVFCGWVCPQNLFNELGHSWDARFGRFGAVLVSVVVGILGGFVLWSYGSDGVALLRRFAAGEVPPAPTVTILAFGAFFAAAMAWWRTDICKVVCPYGHLQAIISNDATMHLELFNLPQHQDICATCGLCAEICYMDVDPRTMVQKDCVTCGDCLDACQLVSGARKVPRVLNFVVGSGHNAIRVGEQRTVLKDLKRMAPRLIVPGVLTLLLLGGTAYGLARRSLIDLVVAKDHRAVLMAGGAYSGGSVMRVSVVNLGSVPDTFRLFATGLPEGWATFEHDQVDLAPGEKADVTLRIAPTQYQRGLYPFDVTAAGAKSGTLVTFHTVHVVGN